MPTEKEIDGSYLTQKRLGLSERDCYCDDFSNEPRRASVQRSYNFPNGFSGEVLGEFDKEGNLEIISKSS